MLGISANNVEAKTNRRRNAINTATSSNVSSNTSISATSNNLDNNLKNNFFNKSAKLFTDNNSFESLFNKETYSYYLSGDYLVCIMKNTKTDYVIKGGQLKHFDSKFSCYSKPENIFIAEIGYLPTSFSSDARAVSPIQMFINKNEDGLPEMDFATYYPEDKDVYSSTTANTSNIKSFAKVKEVCQFESYYKDIKNLLTASTVASGVATATGAAGTALTTIDMMKDKKEGDTDNKLSGMNIADIALSGTSAATSMTSAIMNFVSVDKVNKLSSQMDKCVDASRKFSEELNELYLENNLENGNEAFEKYESIAKNCSAISKQNKTIKTIKGLATASGMTGMIGAAASGASIATTVIGNTSDKADGNKMNLASTITSGIGTAGALGGTTLNATNIAKVQELIESLESCTEAINELQ